MTLFITGSNSFIGSQLVKDCQDRNISYVGVDLSHSQDTACHVGDIRDPNIADLIPDGTEAVIHLAALSRDSDCRNRARECFEVNVMGTLNLMEAAQKKNAQQFIFASSEWVYSSFDPKKDKTEDDAIEASQLTSEYAFSKLVSECNLRQKFLHGFCPSTILRFGIVYGSRTENWSAVEALFDTVATSEVVTVGSTATARRFIHVSDIADGILSVIGLNGFEIINIQGMDLITLDDIILASSEVLGRVPVIKETSANAPNIRNVSDQKAKRLLRWQAKTDLRTGLNQLNQFLTEVRQ